jgi:hypothetical protein
LKRLSYSNEPTLLNDKLGLNSGHQMNGCHYILAGPHANSYFEIKSTYHLAARIPEYNLLTQDSSFKSAPYLIIYHQTPGSSMSVTATITIPQQPDIEYHPDEAKYLARVARNLTKDPQRVKQPLPKGFPQEVNGPIVWEGADWTNEQQWVYNLSGEELKEIQNALDHFKCT